MSLYHGDDAAQAAEEEFDRIFSKGGLPDEIPEPAVSIKGQADLPHGCGSSP